jgi:16S rRNA (uracil1498-N3)-methyltransferase
MKRIWFDKTGGGAAVLSGSEHNHLANVLRGRAGDEVIAVCGDEFDRVYKIENISKKQTVLTFVKKMKNCCNPKNEFVVYLGVIKPDNLALAAQKLNEIGASELKLFSSAFSPVKTVNILRLNEIARQSCKQCGRSIPLAVSYIGGFDDLIKELKSKNKEKIFFADENLAGAGLSAGQEISARSGLGAGNYPAPTVLPPTVPTALVVGGAGGFDENERAELNGVAMPISLGSRILRAETACIAGASKWCI